MADNNRAEDPNLRLNPNLPPTDTYEEKDMTTWLNEPEGWGTVSLTLDEFRELTKDLPGAMPIEGVFDSHYARASVTQVGIFNGEIRLYLDR